MARVNAPGWCKAQRRSGDFANVALAIDNGYIQVSHNPAMVGYVQYFYQPNRIELPDPPQAAAAIADLVHLRKPVAVALLKMLYDGIWKANFYRDRAGKSRAYDGLPDAYCSLLCSPAATGFFRIRAHGRGTRDRRERAYRLACPRPNARPPRASPATNA
jgi:hypothetical protein